MGESSHCKPGGTWRGVGGFIPHETVAPAVAGNWSLVPHKPAFH